MLKNISFEGIEETLNNFVLENGDNRVFWLLLFFGLLLLFIVLFKYLDKEK